MTVESRPAPATASYAHLRDVRTQAAPVSAAPGAVTRTPAVVAAVLFGFPALAAHLVIRTNERFPPRAGER
jgi:hypothetical protein